MERTRRLRRQILRPHQSEAELASHEPAGAYAVGSFQGDELVAVGLIGREGQAGEWRIRGMATQEAARGRGHGSAVLAALLEHALEQEATAVWCQVRVPARGLYERAGFQAESEEFELPDIGPHLLMRKRLT